MNWSKVHLIMIREARDQLRDRRTLFMIAVLPLLLYPLIGMTFLQVAQFMKEHPTRIWVIGSGGLPEDPPLLEEKAFARALFDDPDQARLMELTIEPGSIARQALVTQAAQEAVSAGDFDAVVYFPPDFGPRLQELRARIEAGGRPHGEPAELAKTIEALPQPIVYYNTAKDKSRIARARVADMLHRWREGVVAQTLVNRSLPVEAAQPFKVAATDVAQDSGRRAAVWAKVLPFVLMVWALTGAFYPAIDLCAGEKERGTLETLLSSPAERNEIVWGKLLTVMFFSIVTAVLNLVSMGLTGGFILAHIQGSTTGGGILQIGPPPLLCIFWLLLALLPVAALFSALSLALAAMARSTKEGQYYLVPLLLCSTPLMVLPVLPAAELDLGTSLIPVSGVMLLLRRLIEGEHLEALKYALPVVAVTAGCCLLAIRWAVEQFNNEHVLFRESERFELGRWLLHLVRDRSETPSAAEAVLCGVLLLLIRFFASFLLPLPSGWNAFAVTTVIVQLAMIATPALMMALILTRSPGRTLLLQMPAPAALPAAVLLAVMLHPLATVLREAVQILYPLSPQTLSQLAPIQQAIEQAPGLLSLILVLALVPAFCEELAFRGFILSGLRHMGSKWGAIILSSVLFGVTHGLLQQSLTAFAMGVVIGYVVVQTGSLLPAILFHMVHNGLGILASRMTVETVRATPATQWLLRQSGDHYVYDWPVLLVCGILAALLLQWFRQLPYQATLEEKLHDALAHQSARAAAR